MFKSSHFWKVYFPPHVAMIAGLLMFPSWWILAYAFVFYCLISGLGVAVGFHRYFSHKSFETNRFWQQMMLFWGMLACQGNPVFWVALHRGLHHRYSDTEKDPHAPLHGIWHSYQGYSFAPEIMNVPMRAAADFLRHKDWMWSLNHYHKILWSVWALALGATFLVGPYLFVGLVCAQVWAIHQEALVNLLGHSDGFGSYRTHDTDDKSVNRNLLGLITWGQSLHQNHHHNPARASFALPNLWHFEFDPSMLWIRIIGTNINESLKWGSE